MPLFLTCYRAAGPRSTPSPSYTSLPLRQSRARGNPSRAGTLRIRCRDFNRRKRHTGRHAAAFASAGASARVKSPLGHASIAHILPRRRPPVNPLPVIHLPTSPSFPRTRESIPRRHASHPLPRFQSPGAPGNRTAAAEAASTTTKPTCVGSANRVIRSTLWA